MKGIKKNIVQLAGASVSSQLITIALTPVLTRILSPASFGEHAIFSATNAILAGIFTLKFEQAIVAPTEDGEATMLTSLTCRISAALSSLLLLGISTAVVCGNTLPRYWVCLPLCTLSASVLSSLQQWRARRRDYSSYTNSLLVGATVNGCFALGLAATVGDTPASLIIAFTCGQLTSAAYALFHESRLVRSAILSKSLPIPQTIGLIMGYREYPLFVLPASLALAASSYLPPIILRSYYNAEQVGQYAIAARFALLPSVLIGGAISEAFRANFMSLVRDNANTSGSIRALLGKIGLVGVPSYLALSIAAPSTFHQVLGADYRSAGILAAIMGPASFGTVISQPFHCVFVGLQSNRLGLALQLGLSALPLAALQYASSSNTVEAALLWYSVVVLLMSLGKTTVALHIARRADRNREEVLLRTTPSG